MAVSKYDKEYLSQADQNKIADLTAKAQRGEIGWDQAHSDAEAIRSNAGYSGGSLGNEYKAAPTSGSSYGGTNYHQDAIDAAKAGDWSAVTAALNARDEKTLATGQNYGKTSLDIYQELWDEFGNPMPEYESVWGDQLSKAVDNAIGMKYDDWLEGEQYAALAKRYGLQGEQSMRDVLGQISSRTGGMASSYATSAATQQYNDYMAQLEQAALEMYSGERNDAFENAALLQSLESEDYARHQDALAQWNTDRSWQYQTDRDTLEDQRYEDSEAAARAETLAAYGDFSGYKALGYTDAQIAMMKAAYDSQITAQQAAKKTSAASGSGNGNSGSTGDYDALFEAAAKAVSPQNYISSNYKKYGFSSSSGLSSAYEKWAGNGGSSPSLDYSEDEGVFTFNGEQYFNLTELAEAIDELSLTDSQKAAITRKLDLFGFDIDF